MKTIIRKLFVVAILYIFCFQACFSETQNEKQIEQEFKNDFQNLDEMMKEIEDLTKLLLDEESNFDLETVGSIEDKLTSLKIDMDSVESKWKDFSENQKDSKDYDTKINQNDQQKEDNQKKNQDKQNKEDL
ncbi:hypothetical protein ABPG74_010950 [Tetrahymena malaccensis]